MENNTTEANKKILFVSNNAGTTTFEVMLLITVPILSNLLYSLYLYTIRIDFMLSWERKVIIFITDQVFIAAPSLLVLTFLESNVAVFCTCLGTACMTILFWKVSPRIKDFLYVFQRNVYGESDYLSNYKSAMQIMTCICILAVDFNVFPRRFGKTETYGVSIMDLGVGAFVLSMAVTSKFARCKERVSFKHLFKSCYQSLILFFLGTLRVLLVKSQNYQEHVTEYGTHWNFFFTLALLKTVTTIVLCMLPFLQKQLCYLVLSVVTICCYQHALNNGLCDVISNGLSGDGSRLSFFDANREGIISSIGYLGIYFFGLFLGSQLFKTRLRPFNKICWLFLWFTFGCFCLHYSVTPISRQQVNLSYYFLEITANCFLLFGFFVGEAIMKALCCLDKKDDFGSMDITSSTLSQAVTQNLLLYFLLGNLLTGIVNLNVDTLNTPDTKSFFIISFYMVVLNSVVWFIYFLREF